MEGLHRGQVGGQLGAGLAAREVGAEERGLIVADVYFCCYDEAVGGR